MPQPLEFSIVTCTFNSVATLRDTIDSVQSQRYPHVSHIFVDGGSTDGTLEMIAERCPRATVLTNVRGGISAAMNAGIDAARGDFVAHLHSDDYYVDAQVLERVAERFEAEPAKQWAYGKIHLLLAGEIRPVNVPMRRFTFRRYAAGRAAVAHPAVFVRRQVFDEVGRFDTSLRYAMDIDFWLRLGQHHEPIQIDAPLTVFREHVGSLSSQNKIAAREEEWKVRMRYFTDAPLATAAFGIWHLRRMQRLRREHATSWTA
jgi:glycosyltransferase involved in cell wall biosynthesis